MLLVRFFSCCHSTYSVGNTILFLLEKSIIRNSDPLNDNELLVGAEEAEIELTNLLVDNEIITDEEQCVEEINNVTTLLYEENVYNENSTLKRKITMALKLLKFQNQRKAGEKTEEEQKLKWKKRERLLLKLLHTAWIKIELKNTFNTAQLSLITFLQCGSKYYNIYCIPVKCVSYSTWKGNGLLVFLRQYQVMYINCHVLKILE